MRKNYTVLIGVLAATLLLAAIAGIAAASPSMSQSSGGNCFGRMMGGQGMGSGMMGYGMMGTGNHMGYAGMQCPYRASGA